VLFHLTDRIDSWDAGRGIRARKLTSRLEPYWRPGPDGPVMPRPLVLETLCQAGACLVMLSTDLARRAALLSVARVDFLADVRPGDVLAVDAAVESMGEETAVMSGTVSVGDRVVLRAADVMCALIPAGDLEDPLVTRRRLEQLTSTGGRP
jgi:3-hydroxymyristoyl/3-hydroxydecanoyl-(acyl carrier protein) dehydratase